MKQSVYNIIAIVLLIAGVGYLNIVAIEKQKEAINKIDIVMDKIMFFGNLSFVVFVHISFLVKEKVKVKSCRMLLI